MGDHAGVIALQQELPTFLRRYELAERIFELRHGLASSLPFLLLLMARSPTRSPHAAIDIVFCALLAVAALLGCGSELAFQLLRHVLVS